MILDQMAESTLRKDLGDDPSNDFGALAETCKDWSMVVAAWYVIFLLDFESAKTNSEAIGRSPKRLLGTCVCIHCLGSSGKRKRFCMYIGFLPPRL